MATKRFNAKKESHKRRRHSVPSVARPKFNNPRGTYTKRERTGGFAKVLAV